MSSRRQFIKTSLITSAGLAASSQAANLIPKSHKPLKILFMGGTGFLGPHTVKAAVDAGHKVTLFNRGKTKPVLYPELLASLPLIKGDRKTQDIEQLKGTQWDLVIDTSSYYPRVVNMLLDQVGETIGQYIFISTISVYGDWSKTNMDETTAVGTIDDPSTEDVTGETYGPLKALCEKAAVDRLGDKVTIIRPGLIVGPGDKTDRFTYWPVRIAKGGDVLCPSEGNDFIQIIDVRDLAEWTIHLAHKKVSGVFNAQSNGSDMTIGELLTNCKMTLNPKANLVWVPTQFLEKHSVTPWGEMPTWFPPKGNFAGAGTMSSKKAYANGLKQRPLKTIIQDTYDWFTTLPEERQAQLRAGIKADKEAKVLAAWKKTQTS
ncbi:NAD-dependent epimerase/dehydratase family protein [Kangiella sp. TOML190]|uniref:NAD-dependent epimerase/dehydratase family protein n=1 Tax=Kangiella sp. TOML190 TaxID=2931351 RepID=UPI00203C0F7E|nr:NAD-dependent epimerase/dehydratase family protein [Kangiella sp. TOML190]